MPFHRFVEAVDPSMYADYQKERVVAGLWRNSSTLRITTNPSTRKTPPETTSPGDPLSPLLRVDTLKPDHIARLTCEKRKIPDLTRLYHCPRFYAWTNYALGVEKFSKKALYYDHPRLVIPFLESSNGGITTGSSGTSALTAFQGRDYDPDSDNKYVTIRIDQENRAIYGLDRLGPGTVYALEGPIDSMFLPNGIAFAGSDHGALGRLDRRDDIVVVYDNEPRAPLTHRKIAHAIRDGYRVCIWPKRVIQKDVNDMVLAGIDPKPIIDSRTFSGLEAELELATWKK